MPDLFPYQEIGARWLAETPRALLADEMGLGKTAQAIRAADYIAARRVLVLCPPIARVNWAREFGRFGLWPRRAAVVERIADVTAPGFLDADVIVAPHHVAALGTTASKKAREALLGWRCDALIVDEAHCFKNPQARRTRALYGHRMDGAKGLISAAESVWLLSGTPMTANPMDLWPHMRALWPGALEGELRAEAFKHRFCLLRDVGFGPKVVGSKNLPELSARIMPYVLRRQVEDVLTDLPAIRWSHVSVSPDKLPPRPALTDEERRVLAAAEQRARDGGDVSDLAMHLATLRRWTGMVKADAVVNIVGEIQNKCIVFFAHRDVAAHIHSRVGNSAVINGDTPPEKRQALIDAFQSGDDLRVLICQLAVASTALTLTAASDVVFAETSWTPADLEQAAKRTHRIGQTRPVLVRVVSLAGSIDEDVNATLVKKSSDVRKLTLAITKGAR